MRDLNIILTLVVLCQLQYLPGQVNLIRNWNFAEGEDCNCVTEEHGTSPDYKAFTWEVSGPVDDSKEIYPTPDWLIFPFCLKNSDFIDNFLGRGYFLPNTLFSHEFAGMLADEKNWLEGLRIELKENLKKGSTYLIKMKIGFGLSSFNHINGTYKMGIHFAKYGEKWFDNPDKTDNVQWLYAQTFERQGSNFYSSNEFVSLQLYFTVPDQVDGGSGSDLRHMIIKPNPENFGNFKRTYSYIDDIELYEVSSQRCNSDWLIENKTYEYHELPIEASGTITAGKSVLDNNADGPVICDAKQDSMFGDSRVIYKAGKRVNLKSGFKVEKEAYFRAHIASCGSECLTPTADVGVTGELLICDNNSICFTLGSKALYSMEYEWSSGSSIIESMLTNMKKSAQIYLCIPSSVPNGRYTITYKVKNACGQEVNKDIPLYINRTPFSRQPYIVQWGVTQHWGGYYINGLKLHSHFKATYRVVDCDWIKLELINGNGNIIDVKYYYVDKDFPRYSSLNRDPLLWIDYYKDVDCGNYIFRYTLYNKCSGLRIVYDENTRYTCPNG